LNVAEGSTSSYSRPMWKPTSYTMAPKVSQTASWVPVHSLPWAQHKKWILIGSMGCAHTQQKRPAIEGCDSLNRVQSVVTKIGEDNQKVGKIGRIIGQTLALRPKQDKIRTQWALNIRSKSMLKKV
jgi:hypothetical protein